MSTNIHASNAEKRTLGSATPMFRPEIQHAVDGVLLEKSLSLDLGPPAILGRIETQTAKAEVDEGPTAVAIMTDNSIEKETKGE